MNKLNKLPSLTILAATATPALAVPVPGQVPLPGALPLVAIGLAAMLLFRRFK